MGQPVKVSDGLLAEARSTGHLLNRSAAGQIEFWAQIGRAVEPLLAGAQVVALKRSGKGRKLSTMLASVDSPEGSGRLRTYLRSGPFPRYEPALHCPGMLVRTDKGGKRTTGRFVGREFTPSR